MFERFSEPARRVIFFARYEASVFGSPHIEPEHLLLGLLRENTGLREYFTTAGVSTDAIRSILQEEGPERQRISTSVDLPLSERAKHTLQVAAEEADERGDRTIDCRHVALAILKLENKASSLLLAHGVGYDGYLDALGEPAVQHQPAIDRVRLSERSAAAAPSLRDDIDRLSETVDRARAYLGWQERRLHAQALSRKLWSRKEALGHLIDLATTHHRWFVRALTEPNVTDSGPPLDSWVAAQRYNEMAWGDLVELWFGLNQLLIHVLHGIPEEKAQVQFRIGIEPAAPLSDVVSRYVDSCEDILGQILRRH